MIRFHGFAKRYGATVALAGFDLEVAAGEVVALLGPNGSGKTTSLKGAAGLIRPTAGEVLIGDPPRPASEPAARRACSYLPQKVAFPESLTGREVVDFYRALRGVPGGRVSEVLALASLNGDASRQVAAYSGGMVQRLGLAVTMLADAPVLLLDEPTAALDPEGLSAFYDIVQRRGGVRQTVLFSSHQLDDVERLADRVAILVGGRIVGLFGRRELTDRLADRGVMRVTLHAPSREVQARLGQVVPHARWEDAGRELVVPGAATARPAILAVLHAAGAEIRSLTVEEGRLDTFYRELVEEHR